jgi:hypothetical protein
MATNTYKNIVPTALEESLKKAKAGYDQSGQDYTASLLAGGGMQQAIQKLLAESDPALGQLRTEKAAAQTRLGSVFANSLDDLKDVTDPALREQIRARRSSQYGSEAERIGGLVSDVGAGQKDQAANLSKVYDATTSAKQFDVTSKRQAMQDLLDEKKTLDQRGFESRFDDLTRREKEASIAASNRSGGAGGLTALQLLGLQDSNPLGLAQMKGYTRQLAPDGGKGFWFYNKEGNPVPVDEVANAIGGNKAALLAGSSNEGDQATIKEASGKSALSASAQKDINSIGDAMNVLGKIESSSKAINTSSGPKARGAGPLKSLQGYAGLNADATRFRQNVGYLSRIVRAMGEVGTLNEGDIARANKLIPAFSDTAEEAANKIRDLKDILEQNKQQRLNGTSSTPSATIDLSTFEQ